MPRMKATGGNPGTRLPNAREAGDFRFGWGFLPDVRAGVGKRGSDLPTSAREGRFVIPPYAGAIC
jgi:hypothetical protein